MNEQKNSAEFSCSIVILYFENLTVLRSQVEGSTRLRRKNHGRRSFLRCNGLKSANDTLADDCAKKRCDL